MLDEMRREYQNVISKYSLAVQGGKKSDLSDIVIKLEEKELQLKNEISKAVMIMIEIEDTIDKGCSGFPFKELLKLRYLDCYSWGNIQSWFWKQNIKYSRDTIMKYHQQAVNQLKRYLNK